MNIKSKVSVISDDLSSDAEEIVLGTIYKTVDLLENLLKMKMPFLTLVFIENNPNTESDVSLVFLNSKLLKEFKLDVLNKDLLIFSIVHAM